jgi:hypothetical protein
MSSSATPAVPAVASTVRTHAALPPHNLPFNSSLVKKFYPTFQQHVNNLNSFIANVAN